MESTFARLFGPFKSVFYPSLFYVNWQIVSTNCDISNYIFSILLIFCQCQHSLPGMFLPMIRCMQLVYQVLHGTWKQIIFSSDLYMDRPWWCSNGFWLSWDCGFVMLTLFSCFLRFSFLFAGLQVQTLLAPSIILFIKYLLFYCCFFHKCPFCSDSVEYMQDICQLLDDWSRTPFVGFGNLVLPLGWNTVAISIPNTFGG